jgi:hypothetical protein
MSLREGAPAAITARLLIVEAVLAGILSVFLLKMDGTSPEPLTWRNASTPNLRYFIGADGDWDVSRIYFDNCSPKEGWRWSVYAIVPAYPY